MPLGSYRTQLFASSALAIAAAAGAGPARADTIVLGATTNTSVSGNPTTASSITAVAPNYSPAADLFPSAQNGLDYAFGHTYSYSSGHIGSRSSGSNTYIQNGTASFNDSFTAAAYGDYRFNYAIDSGDVSVSVPAASNGAQSGSLRAVITETVGVAGAPQTLLNYQSGMSLSTAGGTPTFAETGLVLNAAGASLQAGYGDYSWSPYFGSVDLGVLAPGQLVNVLYQIASSTIGSSVGLSGAGCSPLALVAVIGYGGCYGGYGGVSADAIARIGDPFTANAPASSISFTPLTVGVPEPASVAMLGAGLAALAFSRRRRVG